MAGKLKSAIGTLVGHGTPPGGAITGSAAIIATALLLLPHQSPRQALPAALEYRVVGATAKVRPDAALQDMATAAELAAARNEFESFQIVLRNDGELDLEDVDVRPSALRNELGGEIPASRITIYAVRYLRIETPSSRAGEVGDWPDALVPRTDRYADERRNAFPFDLAPGRNQVVWIEVYVPRDTAPGRYTGAVELTAADTSIAAVPLTLQVRPFTLPSTSSLRTSFGFSGRTALEHHHDAELEAITGRYAKAALLHRISLHGGTFDPPGIFNLGGRLRLDWDDYDAELGPLLDGTVLTDDDPLPGARATSVDLRTPALPDEEKVQYWRAFAQHFRDKGWLDRLFFYIWDEPGGEEDYARIRALGELVREADPEIRILLTEHVVPELLDTVDVWVPLVNCIDAKPDHEPWCEGGGGTPEDRVEELWWYQSCASHGCNIVGGEYFDGWPRYVIDAPAVSNRIMPWLAWKYGIEGELYYNTVEAYDRERDPWSGVHLFGGNGDGTLFYPGNPETIGGRTDIPIESIRLKLIREGLEDYEYLQLLAEDLGQRDYVERQLAEVAQNAYRYTDDARVLMKARENIALRLSHLLKGEGSNR